MKKFISMAFASFCFVGSVFASGNLSAPISKLTLEPENSWPSELFTLEKFEIPLIESALGKTADIMHIHGYDTFGFGSQLFFAAQFPTNPNLDQHMQSLGFNPASQFQLAIQNLSASAGLKIDTKIEGKFQKFQPLSFKPQYPYAKYALEKAWRGKSIVVSGKPFMISGYSVKGSAVVNPILYSLHEPKQHFGLMNRSLSIHSLRAGSTLSPDTMHLYQKPLDSSNVQGLKYISGREEISRAVMYSLEYADDWKLRIGLYGGICAEQKLPKEQSRMGMTLLLNNSDLELFEEEVMNPDGNIENALRSLALIRENPELAKILDIL